ncbi:MAG: helix-turn-helix domain-containing protein [Bacteroidetes bacterium]|nr:helix-turn-helix domain-containing protein [Bacteroidota bacterium]
MAKLLIKNMVCDRCIAAVKETLRGLDISYNSVELGEVDAEISEAKIFLVKTELEKIGFELLETRAAQTVNKIKKNILNWVRGKKPLNRKMKFSAYLADALNKDYASLSKLFSETESTTIEQYLIRQKIELAKELLVYDELTLGQIADELNYSSIAHLSNQFKKITGLSPKHFKAISSQKRVAIDKL